MVEISELDSCFNNSSQKSSSSIKKPIKHDDPFVERSKKWKLIKYKDESEI